MSTHFLDWTDDRVSRLLSDAESIATNTEVLSALSMRTAFELRHVARRFRLAAEHIDRLADHIDPPEARDGRAA